jgi:cysteine desulfurase
MHVNNETGVIQPISEYANVLRNHDAFLHVDAAQSYGKMIDALKDKRIDLISASGHKIYGPKGIGILLARCRNYDDPPLEPLMFGGGQEKGIRPGTLPVYLIAAFGEASRLALNNNINRKKRNAEIKERAVKCLTASGGIINGDQKNCLPNTLNISFPDLDSEAIILQLKETIAISNGSACTSSSYTFSHVLSSMGLSKERIKGAVRISWCHLTPEVDWNEIAELISSMRK